MKDLLNRGELWGSVLWDQVVDGFTTAHIMCWEGRENDAVFLGGSWFEF